MMYVIHFLILLILYIINVKYFKKENWFIKSSFIYSVFVFGQRWMTGTDFPYYLRYYINDFTRSEWGYFGLQRLLRSQGLYFGILIFIVFLITQINFYKFIKKINYKQSMMIFVYLISMVFMGQMSQIRQYAAISFFMNSYYNSYNDNYWKSLVNIILASSFHSSAIYFIPFLFIKLPVSRKKIFILFLFSVLLPFIDISILFSLPFFRNFSNYVGSYFDVPLGIFHYINYYIYLILFIFYFYKLKKFKIDKKDKLIINGVIFYIILYGLSIQFAPLYRAAKYFELFSIVFLIFYYDKLKLISSNLMKKSLYIMFTGIYIISAVTNTGSLANYQFRPLRLYEDKSVNELLYEIRIYERENQ